MSVESTHDVVEVLLRSILRKLGTPYDRNRTYHLYTSPYYLHVNSTAFRAEQELLELADCYNYLLYGKAWKK